MSSVELLNWMGSDLEVANAARCSMDKESTSLSEQDVRLIRFLARGMTKSEYEQILADLTGSKDPGFIKERVKDLNVPTHWTPFSQCVAKFRITMPIFVARQWFRHTVGVTRNEVSRRYVSNEPEFADLEWREAPDKSIKQGSGPPIPEASAREWELRALDAENKARRLYNEMIEDGVAPEQARAMLPQSMLTTIIETGSLAAYARICQQRLDSHAQVEVQEVAQGVDENMRKLFPYSWAALMGEDD